MTATINASTSSGVIVTSDTSGSLAIQSNGTTIATASSTGLASPTTTITTLNAPSGVLATQNGMNGICKAWASFSGGGSAATINASFNVSSITRVSTGLYAINYATALGDGNGCAVGMAAYPSTQNVYVQGPTYNGSVSSSTVGYIQVFNLSNTAYDATVINYAIFR